MASYSAYGLTIQSEMEIPELSTNLNPSSRPDVVVRYSTVPVRGFSDPTGRGCAYRVTQDEVVYVKDRCGRFLVKNGSEIQVDPDSGVEDRVWRLSLFGPALGLLLIQRGLLVLHGGAVAFPEGTVLLLGPSGAGKSTLTGELCKQDGRLLTDDVVTIDPEKSPPQVLPGVPLLKLWPDAVEEAPDGVWTKVLHPDFNKVGRRMADSGLSEPSPVARIFLLGSGKKLARNALAGAEAFRPLMASLFAVRYGDDFLAELDGPDLLAKLSRLLQYAPIEILCRPSDRGLLPDTAAMVRAALNEEKSH